jgi:hypothetical protein
MVAGQGATVQIAFKKSLTGTAFMVGVVADAGLKDISKYDYNDSFKESEAGSSVRNSRYYPLGSLYAVDNTCWEAFGLQTTGYEPKFCPANMSATATKKSPGNSLSQTPTPAINILVRTITATEMNLMVTATKDQDPTREPPTNEPPTNEPSTNEPPTNEPPTVEPPTNEPPTVNPPTVEPPTPEPPTPVPPPPPTVKHCDPEPPCGDFDPDTCQCR